MVIDRKTFEFILSLHSFFLIEERANVSEWDWYCGIFETVVINGHTDRDLVDEMYSFSNSKEEAYDTVYEKWQKWKKNGR